MGGPSKRPTNLSMAFLPRLPRCSHGRPRRTCPEHGARARAERHVRRAFWFRVGFGALALGFVTGLPILSGRYSKPSSAADAAAVRLQAFPTGGPCTYEDSWHAPRGTDANGNPLYHEGVDVIARTGTPIYAVAEGTITRMSTSNRGGIQIYLTRSDGTYFFHAHLSAYAPGMSVGTRVTAGQLIAYVGQTGDAQFSVAHLHFEVHPGGGAAVNPYPIVREVDGCYGRPRTTTTTAGPPTTLRPGTTTVPGKVTGGVVSGGSSSPTTGNLVGGLTTVAPFRLADSRSRSWLHRQSPGEVQVLTVAGRGGVAAEATLASLTFTVVNPTFDGFLAAFPCGVDVPPTSTVNYAAGQTVSNSAFVGIGTSGAGKGKVCVRTNVDTDVIVDVGAYVADAGTLAFTPLTPRRLIDTRTTTVLRSGATLKVATGTVGVGAVTVNVTAVDAAEAGTITVWPCPETRPTSATLNMGVGDIVPNAATVALGSDGALCVSASTTTHVVIDLMGTWQRTGLRVAAVPPVRLLDTREGKGIRVDAGQTVTVPVAGVGGLPANVTAAQVNVTTTGTVNNGFITVWPCGEERPTASNLNQKVGTTKANGTVVGLGGGQLCVYSSSPTHLVLDVTGVLT